MKKLYIGNLPPDCEKIQLQELMQQFGTIEECDIISNKNYGFVHMESETEAQEAVTHLDSTNFMGSVLKVQFSTTDVHKIPGVGSKGECFCCGSKGHLSRDCDRADERGARFRGRGRGRGGGAPRGFGAGSRGFGGRRFDGPPPRPNMGRGDGYRYDPYDEDYDTYRRDPFLMRRPRDYEYERRYLEEAYRRLGLTRNDVDFIHRSRSRSPIRAPMYDSDRAYYDRLYSHRPARPSFYDESPREAKTESFAS